MERRYEMISISEEKIAEANKLHDECCDNIDSGLVNSFASYDEGVRDTINWLLDEDGCFDKPYIGREV
jgi:hypothetical protein